MHNEGGLYPASFLRQPLKRAIVAALHQDKSPLAIGVLEAIAANHTGKQPFDICNGNPRKAKRYAPCCRVRRAVPHI